MRDEKLLFGGGYFFLDFKKDASLYSENNITESSYYDPINFETLYFYGKSTMPLTADLKLVSEVRFSYIPKSDGLGENLFIMLVYNYKKHRSFKVDLRQVYQNKTVERYREAGRFWAYNISILYWMNF